MLPAPGIHPVPQGPVVDPQVPGHLRDRLAGRDHHLHGLSLELRAELAAMLWHRTDPLSRAESHCPRSLIHLRANARLRRQTVAAITETTPLASWPDVPCSYLVTGQDRVIGTGLQRRAARERITAEVVEFADSGHSPFLSRPGELADVLAHMADGTV